ncbi:MAG: TonB family protein, partial [Pseudomonadota bacterium]
AFCGSLPARTRRTLGWMALVKFLLPVALLAQVMAFVGAAPGRWFGSATLSLPASWSAEVLTPALPSVAAGLPARDPVAWIAGGIWMAGFSLLFGSWLIRGYFLRRRILAEAAPLSAAVERRLADAAARAGLPYVPRSLTAGGNHGPGTLGAFSPVLILPAGLEDSLSPAELDSVLIHELVHIRRRDNLWSAGQALLTSLFWFHPVVWLLSHRIGLETEKSCDEQVVDITGDPETYVGGIVKSARHVLGVAQPGLAGVGTPPVVSRIRNILAHGSRREWTLLRGAALSAGVLLVVLSGRAGAIAPAEVPALPVVAQPAAPPVAAAAPVPAATPSAPTLSIDFPDEEIRTVVRNVADLFQLNVVMPDTLRGRTTVKLRDVTWRQIFQVVLNPVGYEFFEGGNTVTIVRRPGSATTLTAKSAAVEPAPAVTNTRPAPEKPSPPKPVVATVPVDDRLPPLLPLAASGAVAPAPGAAAPPAPADEKSAPRVYDLKDLDRVPAATFQGRPKYPFELRRNGVTGSASIEFIVDPTGAVADAKAVKATEPEFGEEAVNAVKKWTFRPGMKGGTAVHTRMRVEIVFTLNDK